MQSSTPTKPVLLLTPKQAAEALAVSPRTLWSLTAPRGPIPSLRLGRLVRYRVEALADWLTPAPVVDEADPYVGWIELAGPDGRAMWIHPDHLDDEYLDPPDLCPDCDSMESWWNPLGDRFCMKCDPPITAMRLRQLVAQLRNSRPGRPAAAAKAGA